MNRKVWSLLAASLFAAAGFNNAHSTVLVNDNQPIMGSSAAIQVPLTVSSPGELTVTLSDFGNAITPSPFASLQFFLSDTTSLTPMTNAGTLQLDLTAPETVYVNIFASTQGGFGVYNLTADFESGASVPLPGTVTSLLMGLVALLIYMTRASGPLLRDVTGGVVGSPSVARGQL